MSYLDGVGADELWVVSHWWCTQTQASKMLTVGRWCIQNNVDKGCRMIFIALRPEQQERLRRMGNFPAGKNSSRMLMGRILNAFGHVDVRTSVASEEHRRSRSPPGFRVHTLPDATAAPATGARHCHKPTCHLSPVTSPCSAGHLTRSLVHLQARPTRTSMHNMQMLFISS